MGFSLKKAWVGVRNAALAPAKLAMMPSILATKGITKGFDALTGQNKKQDQSNASSASQIGLTPEEKAQLLQPLPTVTLGKMGGQEEQAKRAQLARELMANQTQAQRGLAGKLAASGVRGGAAAASQSQLARRLMQDQSAQEEKSFVEREAFNRGQGEKEQMANVANQLAMRQLQGSVMGQELQARAAERGYQATAAAANQGGRCCFIFLEATNGNLPESVRLARDEFLTVENQRGYYKLSEVLVPLMRKSAAIKTAVNWLMVKPMTAWGNWYYGQSKYGKAFYPIVRFWFFVFSYLGQSHPFIRESGEVV
jgi:hypothetical protein